MLYLELVALAGILFLLSIQLLICCRQLYFSTQSSTADRHPIKHRRVLLALCLLTISLTLCGYFRGINPSSPASSDNSLSFLSIVYHLIQFLTYNLLLYTYWHIGETVTTAYYRIRHKNDTITPESFNNIWKKIILSLATIHVLLLIICWTIIKTLVVLSAYYFLFDLFLLVTQICYFYITHAMQKPLVALAIELTNDISVTSATATATATTTTTTERDRYRLERERTDRMEPMEERMERIERTEIDRASNISGTTSTGTINTIAGNGVTIPNFSSGSPVPANGNGNGNGRGGSKRLSEIRDTTVPVPGSDSAINVQVSNIGGGHGYNNSRLSIDIYSHSNNSNPTRSPTGGAGARRHSGGGASSSNLNFLSVRSGSMSNSRRNKSNYKDRKLWEAQISARREKMQFNFIKMCCCVAAILLFVDLFGLLWEIFVTNFFLNTNFNQSPFANNFSFIREFGILICIQFEYTAYFWHFKKLNTKDFYDYQQERQRREQIRAEREQERIERQNAKNAKKKNKNNKNNKNNTNNNNNENPNGNNKNDLRICIDADNINRHSQNAAPPSSPKTNGKSKNKNQKLNVKQKMKKKGKLNKMTMVNQNSDNPADMDVNTNPYSEVAQQTPKTPKTPETPNLDIDVPNLDTINAQTATEEQQRQHIHIQLHQTSQGGGSAQNSQNSKTRSSSAGKIKRNNKKTKSSSPKQQTTTASRKFSSPVGNAFNLRRQSNSHSVSQKNNKVLVDSGSVVKTAVIATTIRPLSGGSNTTAKINEIDAHDVGLQYAPHVQTQGHADYLPPATNNINNHNNNQNNLNPSYAGHGTTMLANYSGSSNPGGGGSGGSGNVSGNETGTAHKKTVSFALGSPGHLSRDISGLSASGSPMPSFNVHSITTNFTHSPQISGNMAKFSNRHHKSTLTAGDNGDADTSEYEATLTSQYTDYDSHYGGLQDLFDQDMDSDGNIVPIQGHNNHNNNNNNNNNHNTLMVKRMNSNQYGMGMEIVPGDREREHSHQTVQTQHTEWGTVTDIGDVEPTAISRIAMSHAAHFEHNDPTDPNERSVFSLIKNRKDTGSVIDNQTIETTGHYGRKKVRRTHMSEESKQQALNEFMEDSVLYNGGPNRVEKLLPAGYDVQTQQNGSGGGNNNKQHKSSHPNRRRRKRSRNGPQNISNTITAYAPSIAPSMVSGITVFSGQPHGGGGGGGVNHSRRNSLANTVITNSNVDDIVSKWDVGNQISVMIYEFDNVLSTLANKIDTLQQETSYNFEDVYYYDVEKIELMFGGSERVESLKTHLSKIVTNKFKCFLFSTVRPTYFLTCVLDRIGLLEYFTSTVELYGQLSEIMHVVGYDHALMQENSGKSHLILLKLMRVLKQDHDAVLYIGYEKDVIAHMKDIHACKTYYVETKGMIERDIVNIEKRLRLAQPPPSVTSVETAHV